MVLANVLSRPLRSPAAAARRVEAGDLAARAEPGGASEQREVAEAFNDMTDRLSRVLEAQREFVANASHQLRTPLTGLRLRIEAAALKAADPGLSSELDAAEREAERLARLVTSLLALAREGDRPGAPRPVSLGNAARAAVERWESQGQVVAHGEDDVFGAASDEDVAIVLDNLVENALRYAPPSSEVAIGWRREGERAVLLVDDEGPGTDAGRGGGGLRTLRPRKRRPWRFREQPWAADRRDSRPSLGRRRVAPQPPGRRRQRSRQRSRPGLRRLERLRLGLGQLGKRRRRPQRRRRLARRFAVSGGATLAYVPSEARAELVDGSGAGWSWPQRLPGPRFTLPL